MTSKQILLAGALLLGFRLPLPASPAPTKEGGHRFEILSGAPISSIV